MTSRQVRPQYTETPYRRGSKPSDERSLPAFVDEELKKIEQGFAVIRTQMSFTFDGSGFKLVGDQAAPGPDMVYGTDGSGVKGWKAGSGGGGGSQGVPGRPGYDGVDGEDSYIPGPAGPTGAAGTAGARGLDGRPGLDGLDGEEGPMGLPGPAGATGPSGSPGAQGSPGPSLAYILDPIEPDVILIPGPQGAKGDTGATGGGGGGGVGGTGTTTVDFGAFPGTSDALVAITGQTGIVAGSVVQAWIQPASTADHSADEHWIETIQVSAGNIVPGVGFTIYARNTSQLNEPLEAFGVKRNHISTGTAAASTGHREATVGGSVGGRGTRLYGLYNVAWLWN